MQNSSSPFDDLPRDCWIEVNVAQLAENVRQLTKFVERPLLIAVKGNGYGHGYENAARAFVKGGARYLGVANYAEAMILKRAGISAPIMILGGMLPPEMKLAAAAGFEFFAFRPDHVEALREVPKTAPVRVHIKIDTGMGRIGCFPEEAAGIGKALKSIPGVTIAGLATHFAVASKPGNAHTLSQIEKFEQAIAGLAAAGIRPEIIHAANTPGSLNFPDARFDMVRMGMAAYGVLSTAMEGLPVPAGIACAMQWKARITSSRILPAGSKVSYGIEHEMPHDARVGVLPVGFTDGFRRVPKNVNLVLVEGQERKILGRINMDQCMVDLDGLPDVTGAEVVLLGKQGARAITPADLAKRWGTNIHDVFSGIAMRVPRKVVNG